MDLHRLERLLLGESSFSKLKQLGTLMEESFKGDVYERAGLLIPIPSVMMEPSSEANAANESDGVNSTT